ncbi:uncharacterized protein [Chelonus insularis]|uniref:uncharacterized protein n=1 Tax=Chelonus insularis TaxID=460826 RepID=UPI00158C7577|nr:uncharacterized protein LOC118074850 [Chelonus insularis]
MSGLKVRTWWLAILGFLIASLMIVNNFITDQFHIEHFTNITLQENIIRTEDRSFTIESIQVSGFLVHKPGCRITAFDPADLVAKRFMQKEKPLVCEFGSRLPLVESNDTALYINSKAFGQYYNTSNVADCCWRTFERKKNFDNFVKYEKVCHPFDNSNIITAEFVKVECFRDNKQIYRDYHFFVPRKPLVEERCHTIRKQQQKVQKEKQKKKKAIEKKENNQVNIKNHLSILILGLDSVSRMNFHRMMPKTLETLASFGAIEMMGYNKVGDNTYPNLVPVLSGLSDKELQSLCWNSTKQPFDNCPFLWKNYSKAGYRTIFAEDACSMTTFNYLKPGFQAQPTDYYYRPYCIAVENDIGNTHKLNADLCIGVRKTFENLLNYTKKIVREFVDDPYFAFFWEASLTHDFFNFPQLGDDVYSNTLKYFMSEGLLENTLLILMSDHGMRWGEFRQTYQGRVEGSLPMVSFVFPDWWKRKYSLAWNNLQKNAASLTTPFDLHETLIDLLNSENIDDESIRNRSINISDDNLSRGISWFLPIPDKRTCSAAGIPGHWCMCHESVNITLDDPVVKNSTEFMIYELNAMIKKYPQCSQLAIKTVIDAKMWSGQDGDAKDNPVLWTDYTVTIETTPGDAIFEASIRRNNTGGNSLVGSVSRLNTYGKQSACINDSIARLYCYCR